MKIKKWYRVTIGEFDGLYELKEMETPKDVDAPIKCPCCGQEMKALGDIVQWGFFEDKYETFFLCSPCIRVYNVKYTVPTYALCPKKKQGSAMVNNPAKHTSSHSKKTSEAGSDQRER